MNFLYVFNWPQQDVQPFRIASNQLWVSLVAVQDWDRIAQAGDVSRWVLAGASGRPESQLTSHLTSHPGLFLLGFGGFQT